MNSLRVSLAAASLLVLSACASTPGPTAGGKPAPAPAAATAPRAAVTEEFRTSDFAWSAAPGKGRIDGQFTYKLGGVAYGCVEAGVLLTPQTPWTRARMNILYRSTERATLPAAEVRARTPPSRSTDYSAFVRRTACDATGRFSFTGLPDGDWYVITVAKPVGGAGADMAIMRHVTTRGGKAIELKL